MALLASVNGAVAADAYVPEDTTPREWYVVLSPYVWVASLNGNASLGGLSTEVDVPFRDVFDHLDFAIMGNIALTNGRWGVYVDGQHVQTSQKGNLFDRTLALDTKMTSVSVGAFYRVFEMDLDGQTAFGEKRQFAIEPTAGVRWTELKVGVKFAGMGVNKGVDWVDPFVGLRVSYDLSERWNLAGEANIGGFAGNVRWSSNAQAYLGYRTYMFGGRPTTLRAGYRILSNNYETGDFTGNKFKWDVEQHGFVLGFSTRL